MDVVTGDKTARFDGELLINGFCAYRGSMRWLPPHHNRQVSSEEEQYLICAVLEETKDNELKICFE